MNKLFYILTADFYSDYQNLKEIMIKQNRPYFMYQLIIDGVEFAIPLRSHIDHNDYFFTGYSPEGDNCGIDYSKAVIITDKNRYLEKTLVKIRKTEYLMIIGKEHLIKKGFLKYIKKYKKAYKIVSQGKGSLVEQDICQYSTLQNYHNELGI
ncbi:type III toxin-antitoxin system TenpIN family toxin [Fusobacterium sp.]|uniref:type III toxin-antitoxin system TenpIN family toxin n=1 Tax=Fusobacterium sp. TaxID=68766 RepID=UPI002904F8F9|nr:hypothetical protein [Fusobacterium sp.]MDU1912589.1 hypothetical protein [Fusobacterium sp.]